MYGRLMSFCLDLEHYRRSDGFTNDRRRIQPKTQRQFNLIRHKAALLLRQMPQFDTHAVQPGADAHAAEVSRRVIENIFYDPLKAYHDPRARFVISALAGGRGNMAIDWHQKWGVCFRFADPRRVHITPGHTFLHSVFNPAVHEEVPMRMSEVEAMRRSGWSIPKDLNPDNWKAGYSEGGAQESKRVDLYGGDGSRAGAEESEEDDGLVTVLRSWYREDPYRRRVKKETEADLPPEEWVWMDDSLGVSYPFDPANPVPPMSEATGQPLRLVTARREMYEADEYDKGYLVITAPFYAGRKPLFEGSWTEGALNPDAYLSAFPYMELVGYKNPMRRTGMSDTELTHSTTIVDNSSFRSTYEQMSVAGGILAILDGAFKDSEGKPFRITSDPINIAHTSDRMALEAMKFFQAPGMNPAMPAFRQMIADQWQHIGTGDFAGALGPERSKDIAVGTANLLQQTGDLPVQLHGQDLALQEAIGARVALDYCAAYMGDNAISWVTDEGDVAYATVRGSDLVPLNVTVRADREWRQQDTDRAQATAQMLGMAAPLQLPPPALAALLKDAGLSANTITALVSSMGMGGPAPPGSAPPPPQAGGDPQLEVVQGGSQ